MEWGPTAGVSWSSIHVANSSHPIFRSPNDFGGADTLNGYSGGGVGMYQPNLGPEVTIYAFDSSLNYGIINQEFDRYFFWGATGDASTYSSDMDFLLYHLLENSIASYQNPHIFELSVIKVLEP